MTIDSRISDHEYVAIESEEFHTALQRSGATSPSDWESLESLWIEEAERERQWQANAAEREAREKADAEARWKVARHRQLCREADYLFELASQQLTSHHRWVMQNRAERHDELCYCGPQWPQTPADDRAGIHKHRWELTNRCPHRR